MGPGARFARRKRNEIQGSISRAPPGRWQGKGPRRQDEGNKNMTAINNALKDVTLGDDHVFENLCVTPLLAPNPGAADYMTLDEAQAGDLAVISEISESGSVPTLLLKNRADVPLLLLDGEELVGAKQNRIVNLTLLAPANAYQAVPVSGVERGRWRRVTNTFSPSDRAVFSQGRARKAARVSQNMRARASRHADQRELWDDISRKMHSMQVISETDAIADAYDYFAKPIDAFVSAFSVAPNQVGACFSINGVIRGIELFGAADTCARLMPKLVRSYALDAIDEKGVTAARGVATVASFLQDVRTAPIDSFEALGEGEDLRIRSSYIAGGALAVGGSLVHLCAFSHESDIDAADLFGGATGNAGSR